MQHFNFSVFAPLKQQQHNPCETLLQPAYCSLHHSFELIQQHPSYTLLSFFASPKTCIFKKVIQRHIFSCCESLECPRSNSPAGLTCFVGRENVELANASTHCNQTSVCHLCSPSRSLLSSSLFSFPSLSSCLFPCQDDFQPNMPGRCRASVIYL